MKPIGLLTLLMTCFWALPAQAQLPFNQYPAKIYTGKAAAIQWKQDTRMYRTRFKELQQRREIDFAGRYQLDFAGCGTNCILGLLYNKQTGKTQMLFDRPIAPCYSTSYDQNVPDEDGVWFEKDSHILAISEWEEDPKNDTLQCYLTTYVEKNGRFEVLSRQFRP